MREAGSHSDSTTGGAGALVVPDVLTGRVGHTLFLLALPVFGEQILNTFVGLFDTWLAGQISAVATSAVGLAAYVGWLASMIVMLVATGTTALVARCAGSGDPAESNRYANQSLTLAAMLGALLLVGLWCLAPSVAAFTNMTGEAYAITVTYLRTDALGHTFMSVTLVGCAALRGVGDMRTPMLLFAVVNVINVAASTIFVFAAGLGVNGIVAGTVTARVVGAVLILAVLARKRAGLVLKRHELRVDRRRARRILAIGVPAAVDGIVMWSGHFVFLAVVSRVFEGALGQACFAAHIIAVRVEALTYLPAIAWGTAAATMIGQSLGAGRPDRAKRVGHQAVIQCGLLSIALAVVFYLSAAWIYDRMSLDPLVRAAGTGPFRFLAILQPTMVVSIVYVWSLRGAGDTRSPMLITVIGTVIRLAAGYYCGIVLGGGLLGAWIGMFGDMVWRALASTVQYTSGRWLSTKV